MPMAAKDYILPVIVLFLAASAGIYIATGGNKPQSLAEMKQLIADLLPGFQHLFLDSSDGKTDSLDQSFTTIKQGKVFSKEDLMKYDGSEGSNGLYLAILGHVYDVEKGRRHYGPGGGYHFFTGKDGTRAFISGDFTEKGLIEDTNGLSPADMLGIKEWLEFYEKDYEFVGLLEGLYYDANGKATPALLEVEQRMKVGLQQKKSEAEERQQFPPCNSQWTKKAGGKVWCTKKSGGISRDWVGVPRKLYKAGSTDFRCACIRKSQLNNPLLQEYEDCDSKSHSCSYQTK
ncbi:neuferricin-like [Anneissia japonica]|uniref:neuferricin-like n=1 Tax=Anneissia japonica TaxID=1529436 RepID=UPI00142599E6|nr:neuferricin-like [Anneissia japonica]